MRPTDAVAAMAAEVSLGLMVDRRRPGPDRPLPEAMRFVSPVDLDGGDPGVSAWLVRSSHGSLLPSQVVSSGFGVQVRLMDRFYLPETRDPGLVRTMFDLIADLYEGLVARDVNLATARELLGQVLGTAGPAPLILDFGCGTGIAAEALASLGAQARLLGIDLSMAMLRRALARGEPVMSLDKWRDAPPLVDGAIACFVLHYGVPDEDLRLIARSLLPGCSFSANFFRGSAQQAWALAQSLTSEGLELVGQAEISGTRATNVLITFRKRQ